MTRSLSTRAAWCRRRSGEVTRCVTAVNSLCGGDIASLCGDIGSLFHPIKRFLALIVVFYAINRILDPMKYLFLCYNSIFDDFYSPFDAINNFFYASS